MEEMGGTGKQVEGPEKPRGGESCCYKHTNERKVIFGIHWIWNLRFAVIQTQTHLRRL